MQMIKIEMAFKVVLGAEEKYMEVPKVQAQAVMDTEAGLEAGMEADLEGDMEVDMEADLEVDMV